MNDPCRKQNLRSMDLSRKKKKPLSKLAQAVEANTKAIEENGKAMEMCSELT